RPNRRSRRSGCASARRAIGASCQQPTWRSSRIGEELLRAARNCADRRGRRDQAGVPRANRQVPSRQGPPSREGVPGDGGRPRRRAHRSVPDPLRRRPAGGIRSPARQPPPSARPPRPRPPRPGAPPPATDAYVPPTARPSSPPKDGWAPSTGPQFRHERATRDEFVRKATMGRLRMALETVSGTYDEAAARGFDIALVPKKKLFSSNKNPRLLGRFVSTVDREAVADAWTQAAKWAGADEACVLLMGTALASAGDLATEIGDQ